MNFWEHSKKQTGFEKRGFIPKEELMLNLDKYDLSSSIGLSPLELSPKHNVLPDVFDFLSSWNKEEIYWYASPKGSDILIPTDFISEKIELVRFIEDSVNVKGDEFFDRYKIEGSANLNRLIIGDSIIYDLNLEKGTLVGDIRLSSSLRMREKELSFIVRSTKEGQFSHLKTTFSAFFYSNTQNQFE